MSELLPGTEVHARGLRWEVVFSERLGPQTLYRLRGLEGAVKGQELDLLHPFEPVAPIIHELQPEKAAPLRNWLVYHQAFLLEQALGPDALLAVQPGRLRLEPYQLVPVLRAIRMSRPRLLLADGVGYIMDTFPIVKRRDEAAHGEYRTKRVILEIYDEMQRARETGQPCQTRLDPPPADPSVAHPPKE